MGKRTLMLLLYLGLVHYMFSQSPDTTKSPARFGGAITVTNNGISVIPTFTLGKPAVIFDLTIGKKRLSFEPQLRFALEGKPWSFIFWWRYKLISTSRYSVRIGAHPALTFSSIPIVTNGQSKENLIAQRYLAGEFTAGYILTKYFSIGTYYLYSFGIDNENVRNTNFVTFNMNFSNINLSKHFFVSYTPQVYYLRINNHNGFNFTSLLSLASKDFPLVLTAFINKAVQSDIPGGKSFAWNVSLIYSFSKKYQEL